MSVIGEVGGIAPSQRPSTAVGPPRQIKLSMVDRLIDAVSPTRGMRRYLERVQQARMEDLAANFGYVGGRYDKKSMQEWTPSSGSALADQHDQQDTLRGRSRDLVRNAPVATAAMNTSVTNIIGTGLRLSSEVDADYLGLGGDEAKLKQTELERLWRVAKDHLEWEGDTSQTGLQGLVWRACFESGDILVIRRSRLDPDAVVGTKIQLIEADRVSNPQNVFDTQRIAGGVEVDGTGRTVAYHVANRHPGDLLFEETTSWNRVPKTGRNGIALSRLIFEKRRPGQRRGVPSLAPIMEPLKQLSRLTEYELMSSVVASMFTVFVKSENIATGQLPVAPVGETAPSNAGEIFMPGGGAVIDLKPGEDIIPVDPNRPNGAFAPFFEALVVQIGSALEIPFEVLMHRYQNSYSAARAATLDAFRFWMTRRDFIANSFCQPVYEWVVLDAVARGQIDLPGFLTDPMARMAWLGSSWIGSEMSQINPKDDVAASLQKIDGGLSTRKIETARLLGLDWDKDVQPQREREQQILLDAGMATTATAPAGGAQPASDDADEGDDQGDTDSEQEDAA